MFSIVRFLNWTCFCNRHFSHEKPINLPEFVKTVTFDNGKEFALHETIAFKLDCETYWGECWKNNGLCTYHLNPAFNILHYLKKIERGGRKHENRR